ncbi:uncharacterized protein SETTUDRAFT_129233 [Exserohilum turcica Et28A]|uniref:Uncharacterized protein n=1 Tax=Exserohilum turcicum (strain 28A) TaxID=671987 RepID=R0IUC8_EXST2|nr:uncharacterized protein SETTUDRAFT_129233 [Exserohilum turcica Et28A]EOA88415.1 hypothetical protein SETTUDRAFT_129233 [Exserohilum turcica Et28A]
MALVTRFLMPKHPKHAVTEETLAAPTKLEQQPPVTQTSPSWKRLLILRYDSQKYWVPNLLAVLKAADDGLLSSSLLAHINGPPGQLELDTLYQAFANEMRGRSITERSTYPLEMNKFLSRARKPMSGLGRSKSMSQINPRTQRKSMDLSKATELGLSRNFSVKKPASSLVSMRSGLQENGTHQTANKSWMKDGQTAKYQGDRMRIKVTAAELTALAVILGSEPNKNIGTDRAFTDMGAYGICITPTRTQGSKYHITLTQNKLSRSQRHALGSGVSTIFAKHLAAGSLPYRQDKLGVHSILITEDTFDTIQAGTLLGPEPSATQTQQSKFLTSLPNSTELKFYALTSTQADTSTTLLNAIAALPFSGGLPPLASSPMIKTIKFIASGNLETGKLLQRLEALVDKVHRQAPHLNIFGPLYEPQNTKALYRERERLRKLDTDPQTPDTLADKSARMSRYITLLERLMALVPDSKPQNVLKAVQKATQNEIQRAYDHAVGQVPRSSSTRSAESHLQPPPGAQTTHRSTSPLSSLRRRSIRFSFYSNVTSPSNTSETSVEEDNNDSSLAKQMERVLKSELPLDVATVASVARMVLVAWTLSVGTVAWNDNEEGYRIPDLTGWDKMTMS